MEDTTAEETQSFSANSDICQQLLTRYARSSAAQHRHLIATAAATRSIIQSSSLPLTPISYFAATITSLSDSENLDANALGALTSFLAIVLPLVGRGEINPEKAGESVRTLVATVEENGNLGTSGVRAVVKCVGVLVAEFCNLNEWDSVAVGFEWLVKFSLDKRPKVRKCAHDCFLTVFKSFESPAILKKASNSIYLLLKDQMPLATEMTTSETVDGANSEAKSKPEHQNFLFLLNVMKHVVEHLSPKLRIKMLTQLLKILGSQFSTMTKHILDVISAIFETSGAEVIISNAEEIFGSLVSYISSGEENPADSVLFAANLAKTALAKLHDGDTNQWNTYSAMLIESLAGLLSSKGDVALQTSIILRDLIDHHIDGKSLLTIESQEMEDKTTHSAEFKAIQSTCTIFYNVLSASAQIPNEHFFSVVSFMFLKLGKVSDIFMKLILLKIADLVNASSATASEIKTLQDCIGSAVAAMGPEKLLAFLPISFSTKDKDCSCSNTWLIPILKKNIVGSSLQFFMENIIPLAESFEKGSHKVKKSVIRRDLQAYAHGCWGLLPAFCHQASDTYQKFGALVKLLIPFIKEGSFMLEHIATGLQELVNENKRALANNQESAQLTEEVQRTETHDESAIDPETSSQSRKTAKKNIKALALYAKKLLQPLVNVLFQSPPETRKHLKGAIGCLVSICEASVIKEIFIASLEKFQLLDDIREHGEVESDTDGSINEKENGGTDTDGSINEKENGGTNAKRLIILDLASCIIEGSDSDLVNLLFSIIKRALKGSDEVGQIEAYRTLSRILEMHSWFCSSQFDVVMNLLTETKSSANITLLESRFACLQTLLVHALLRDMDGENTQAFHILNEIILTLKDSSEEGRKAAYDALHGISSKLRSSSEASSDGLYHKLIAMITGYLSGPSPHIKSGVVSVLSVLVYSDPDICTKNPDLFPSVMELLHSKTTEIIKAVLGFVKVLVSCLKPNDLHHFLPDIVDGILRWSSVTRNHFKTKIVVILEIMMRKCGAPTVKALAPEKYKDFMQDVLVNRHGKASSREAESKDTKPEHSDSSLRGQQKRKRDDSAISSKEEGSSRPWKRKMDRKQNAGKFSDNGGMKHKERRVMKKNDEGNNIRRPNFTSKFTKHRKVGRKHGK